MTVDSRRSRKKMREGDASKRAEEKNRNRSQKRPKTESDWRNLWLKNNQRAECALPSAVQKNRTLSGIKVAVDDGY